MLGGSLLYFPDHGAVDDDVWVISPLFWVFLGYHRRRIGVAVSVSGGPNAPVWGTGGTHELSGASAVPGGG